MDKMISFIVPAYNVEKYIDKCIRSITSQEYDEWELIIVDDGSTDSTLEICKVYAQKDERIKVICQQNAGSAVARNSGLDVATGKWIAFVDADDWIEVNYLKMLYPYIQSDYDFIMYSYFEVKKNQRIDMCQTQKEILLDKEKFHCLVKDVIDTERRVREVANSRSQFWTKLFRREFLVENHISIEPTLRMCQDVMFNLQVYYSARKALFIPVALYNYRILNDSTCHRYSKEQLPRILKLTEVIGDFSEQHYYYPEISKLYQKRILVSLVNICRLDFCHVNNPDDYFTRRKGFLSLCSQEPFCAALNAVVIRQFSFKKQICMWLVKFKCFALLCLFLRNR